jgi:hypothetical protein
MAARHEQLVEDLAGHLAPVRPLLRPGLRAAAWLGAALALGVLLATRFATIGLEARAPMDFHLAMGGALLTAICAAYAAFATSVPGRPVAWAFLPVPPAALWLAASGLGCLRAWVSPVPDLHGEHEAVGCLGFLVCVSIPLSLLIVAMLRRACPLRPNLTAALAGLAVAAAAAALLAPFHPHDAAMTDILTHAVVVAGVIGVNVLAGGRLLTRG